MSESGALPGLDDVGRGASRGDVHGDGHEEGRAAGQGSGRGADQDPGHISGRLPRLRFDDLLEELQARIDAVRGSRDRMHSLLDAVLSVGGELELPQVLQRIADAAVLLVDAEYGALGVVGEDGTLSQFVPVNLTEQQAAAIASRPPVRGPLKETVRSPLPPHLPEPGIRSRDLGAGSRDTGQSPDVGTRSPDGGRSPDGRDAEPRGTAPDRTDGASTRPFLGVPIRVRDEVFGNLYLAGKRNAGEFDGEDEAVLSTLASAAGVAVENARLYEEARYSQRWMEANAEVTRALLSGVGERRVLGLIVELARTILSADLGALALPEEDGQALRVAVAAGSDAEYHRGLLLPREGSFVGAAMDAGEVTTSADVEHDPRITAGPPRWAGMGPAVAVPMIAEDAPSGVLLLARAKPRPPFSEPQVAPLSAFAGQAAVAMELAERRRDAEQITLLEERDRIARDLHDLAIQRLFATGMTLQSAARFVDHPKAGERLLRAVEDLDATIKIIRSTIFGLRAHDNDAEGAGLRGRVTEAVQDVASALGFTPELRMEGMLDTDVPQSVADEAVAALREALSNVARHAGASSVEVTAETTGETFTLTVVDDGVGIPEGARHSGLQNLAERAGRLGGELRLGTPSGGGTRLIWRVPVGDAASGD